MRSIRLALTVFVVGCAPPAPPTASSPPPVPAPSVVVEPSAPEPAPDPTSIAALLAEEEAAPPIEDEDDALEMTESGLGITEVRVGDGPEVLAGDEVQVHYVGRLGDGTVFDESRPRGAPFRFEVGAELVIAGLDEGVVGMRVGGVRRLLIPPHLGYGSRGAPPKIPPDAILEFEVEVVGLGGARGASGSMTP